MSDPLENLGGVLTGLGASAEPRIKNLVLIGTMILTAVVVLSGVLIGAYIGLGDSPEEKIFTISFLVAIVLSLAALMTVILLGILAVVRQSDARNGA